MRCVILSVATLLLATMPASSFAEESHSHTVDGNFVCNRDIVRTYDIRQVDPEELKPAVPTASRRAATIILNAGPGLSGNAQALAAWNDAVDLWESVLGDNVTIRIDGNLAALPPGVLGSTASSVWSAGYTFVRDQVAADRAGDESIVASLPTAAQTSFNLPNSPPGMTWDGDLYATRAVLSALGNDMDSIDPGGTDAEINFSTGFLSSFDFDPTNGIGAGKLDFFAIVVHEIGHALGFTSSVDVFDFYANSQNQAIIYGPTVLDMFRLSPGAGAAGFSTATRILTDGSEVSAQVFYDGIVERRLSTGAYGGDGNQASHWRADEQSGGVTIGLMDPTIGSGQLGKLTNSDVRALGLIGWDVNYLADCNNNDIGDQFDIWAGDEADCNDNQVPDACDISSGAEQDLNFNGVPDSCEYTAAPEARRASVVIAPNPFNPRTEIKLTLSEDARGRVSVYDLAGRHIATLANRGFGAGTHSVIWEGKDGAGRGVSSGVYFVIVDLDGEVQRHKVALVR